MSDAEIIKNAYQDLVKQIFEAYWESVSLEDPSPEQIQQAEAAFGQSIVRARKARDRAIALLPK